MLNVALLATVLSGLGLARACGYVLVSVRSAAAGLPPWMAARRAMASRHARRSGLYNGFLERFTGQPSSACEDPTMPVPMELSRIIISEINDQQVIYLKEIDGQRSFPILIGLFEASSIERRVKGFAAPAP